MTGPFTSAHTMGREKENVIVMAGPDKRRRRFGVALGFVVFVLLMGPGAAQSRPPAVKTLRLYAFNLGNVGISESTVLLDQSIPLAPNSCCIAVGYLIVHPKGTLMWDTGVVPDAQVGAAAPQRRGMTVEGPKKTLREQLLEVGYRPGDVDYLGLSHMHFDHTANANAFENAIWIVQEPERNAMFPQAGTTGQDAANYAALKSRKTIVLANVSAFDVFGDGTVIVMSTPGHTPGHQVLVVKLPKTGPVVLAGDLYHFREERAAGLVPRIDFNKEQTKAARQVVEDYVKRTGAQLWIEHDTRLYETLKHPPAYIE